MKLALRDLFWAVLIAAIGIAWGLEHMRVAKAFANAQQQPSPLLSNPYFDRQELARRTENLARLRSLSDEALPGSTPYYLAEMSRRRLSDRLHEMYDRAKEQVMLDPNDPAKPPVWENRQLLTALRRAEGKPDPLQIEIVSIKNEAAGPLILPRVRNVDVDGELLFVEQLGEGKAAQYWWLQLRDAQGRPMAGLDTEVVPWEGGLSSSGMLRPDTAEDNDFLLNARKHVKPPPTGKYSLVVVHADSPIVNDDDLAGRIYWQSASVPVIVENHALASKWELIRLPLAIVALVLLGCLILVASKTLRPASSTSPLWFNARDQFAIATISLVTAGWACDIYLMKDGIEKSGLDMESSWTMRLVR